MATNSTRKFSPNDAKAAAEALGASPSADAPGVDKIRELLFGNQMQDYDRRFETMEERFEQKLVASESESNKSLNRLEASLKKQLDSLTSQFRDEKEQRTDSDKSLDRGLREYVATVEKRVGQTADHVARLERDFGERLDRSMQELRDEIRQRNEEMQKTVERMFAELSNVKTDRNLLAGLFVEIAKCLNQDVTPKGLGKGSGNAR